MSSVLKALRKGIKKTDEDTIIALKPRQAALVLSEEGEPTFFLPHSNDDEEVSVGVIALTALAVVLSSEDLFSEAMERMESMRDAPLGPPPERLQ